MPNFPGAEKKNEKHTRVGIWLSADRKVEAMFHISALNYDGILFRAAEA
jgi:hypothetical protein